SKRRQHKMSNADRDSDECLSLRRCPNLCYFTFHRVNTAENRPLIGPLIRLARKQRKTTSMRASSPPAPAALHRRHPASAPKPNRSEERRVGGGQAAGSQRAQPSA